MAVTVIAVSLDTMRLIIKAQVSKVKKKKKREEKKEKRKKNKTRTRCTTLLSAARSSGCFPSEYFNGATVGTAENAAFCILKKTST